MKCRGIRGAITAAANTESDILAATTQLLTELVRVNAVPLDDVAAILFTCSPDLNATYPAKAARALGYGTVPLMCAQEMDVPGGVPRCIRLLVMVNTTKTAEEVVHVYLGGASVLRPEFARR